jgi:hypothetical protein
LDELKGDDMSEVTRDCFTCKHRHKYPASEKYYCGSGMSRFPVALDCSYYSSINLPVIVQPKNEIPDNPKIVEGRTLSADVDNKVLRYWKLP